MRACDVPHPDILGNLVSEDEYTFFLFINKTAEVAYDSVEDRSASRIRERTTYVQSAANIGLVCSGIHKVSFPVIDVSFPRRCGRESEN